MAKMWSGRFAGGVDAQFEQWQRSFEFDQRLLPQELEASRAYALALANCGVLDRQEVADITDALAQIGRTTNLPVRDADDAVEDVHHYVELRLAAIIGETALKLHSGRSRNEQIATDLRLYLREQCRACHDALYALMASLVERAETYRDDIMPAYTHLQRAEPMLVAHWLLAYFEMFKRDAHRIEDAAKRMNECPLGSGPVVGSTLPLDREFLARELGFDRPCANSLDATADRDFLLEYVNALSQAAVHLSRLAEEMILFASQEYGFVELPDAFSTGSSAMPQKKNPDAFELMRAKAARVLACATALASAQKGLPLGYNKDLQELQPILFDACDTALGALQVAASLAKAVEFRVERMRAAATSGYMNAMAMATYLVNKGVPFRRAHEQVGAAVRYAIEKQCELEDLGIDDLRHFAPLAEADIYDALAVESVLNIHDVIGGTARHRVASALAAANRMIAARTEAEHAHA